MSALERAPLYKRDMQAMKIQWLGLKLSPHLFFGLGDGKDREEEDKKWEEAEKNVRFYPPGGTPSLLSWEVKGATKALKEMEED